MQSSQQEPTASIPMAQAEQEEPASEYHSFDYYDHKHMDRWDGMNVCALLAGLAILLFMVLLFTPRASLSAALFFFFVGCAFCCFRSNPRLRIFALTFHARNQVTKEPRVGSSWPSPPSSPNATRAVHDLLQRGNDIPRLRIFAMAHHARNQVTKEPRVVVGSSSPSPDPTQALHDLLPPDNDAIPRKWISDLPEPDNDAILRNWTRANGTYTRVANPGEGVFLLELHFSKFGGAAKKPLWKINGKMADGSFCILHGLLAENGKLYWCERHSTMDDRVMLVRGFLDYNTFRFVGTWIDNLGCTGSYATLERQGLEVKDVTSSEKTASGTDSNVASTEQSSRNLA
jgi:hypothetical protein